MKRALKQFTATKDPEWLHLFRVESKKLNAIAWLTRSNGKRGKSQKGVRKKFGKLFKQAGKIRVLSLNLQWWEKKSPGNQAWMASLRQQLQQESRKLIKKPGIKKTIKRHYKITVKALRPLEEGRLRRVLRKQAAQVVAQLTGTRNPDKWHQCRKQIKRLQYLSIWLPERSAEFAELTKTGKLIGDWHDRVLLMKWLSSMHWKDKAVETASSANALEEKILKQIGRLRAQK